MNFRVMDVNKPLVSAHEMVKRGYKIVLDNEDSYFVNKATGVKTELVIKNGVYTFPVWLYPAEHPRKESTVVATMEDFTVNKETMTVSPFHRRADWP